MNGRTKLNNHTPGPWVQYAPTIDGECEQDYRSISAGKGFRGNGFQIMGFIGDADATLMVAAPELLEALEDLVGGCEAADPGVYSLDSAKEAIAKARGIAEAEAK